jgi:hypothetical protein
MLSQPLAEDDYPMFPTLNDQSHVFPVYFHEGKTLKTNPKWQSLAEKLIRLDGVIVPSGDRGYNHL